MMNKDKQVDNILPEEDVNHDLAVKQIQVRIGSEVRSATEDRDLSYSHNENIGAFFNQIHTFFISPWLS